MTNILIVNFGGTLNKGSAALVIGKYRVLSNHLDNPKFTLLTYPFGMQNLNIGLEGDIQVKNILISGSPKILFGKFLVSFLLPIHKFFRSYFNTNICEKLEGYTFRYTCRELILDVLSSLHGYLILFYSGLLYITSIYFTIPRSLCPTTLRIYYESDVIINTGGDVLTDDYSAASTYLSNLFFGIALNKPVIILAESVGPFNSISKRIAKFILNRTKLITLREELSFDYLTTLGVDKPPIHVTADIAFALEPIEGEKLNSILSFERIPKDKPLVGISASKIVSRFGFENINDSRAKYDKYLKIMAKLVDYLVSKINATILFIPHVYGPGDSDDRLVAVDMMELIINKENVVIINNEYSPEELKGIIGQCDLFIGSRMHAMIASTSMLVPTVAIAYSNKTHGVIGKMLGLDNYVLDIKDFSENELLNRVDLAWNNRANITAILEERIPLVKAAALSNGKLVGELIYET